MTKTQLRDGETYRCLNCKETVRECACMRNKCFGCGKSVGNITFTYCDECLDKPKVAAVVAALLLGVFALSCAKKSPPPAPPPELEQGVSSSRSVLAAPAEGRSVLAEIDLLPLVHTNIVGCLVLWGAERGVYTNSIHAIMPETTVPPTAQMATARINNLDPAVPHYYFAVQLQAFDGTNYSDYSAFHPTNGLRWPPIYEDEVVVKVSYDGTKTWTNLGVVVTAFTNDAALYRVQAIRTEVP